MHHFVPGDDSFAVQQRKELQTRLRLYEVYRGEVFQKNVLPFPRLGSSCFRGTGSQIWNHKWGDRGGTFPTPIFSKDDFVEVGWDDNLGLPNHLWTIKLLSMYVIMWCSSLKLLNVGPICKMRSFDIVRRPESSCTTCNIDKSSKAGKQCKYRLKAGKQCKYRLNAGKQCEYRLKAWEQHSGQRM